MFEHSYPTVHHALSTLVIMGYFILTSYTIKAIVSMMMDDHAVTKFGELYGITGKSMSRLTAADGTPRPSYLNTLEHMRYWYIGISMIFFLITPWAFAIFPIWVVLSMVVSNIPIITSKMMLLYYKDKQQSHMEHIIAITKDDIKSYLFHLNNSINDYVVKMFYDDVKECDRYRYMVAGLYVIVTIVTLFGIIITYPNFPIIASLTLMIIFPLIYMAICGLSSIWERVTGLTIYDVALLMIQYMVDDIKNENSFVKQTRESRSITPLVAPLLKDEQVLSMVRDKYHKGYKTNLVLYFYLWAIAAPVLLITVIAILMAA